MHRIIDQRDVVIRWAASSSELRLSLEDDLARLAERLRDQMLATMDATAELAEIELLVKFIEMLYPHAKTCDLSLRLLAKALCMMEQDYLRHQDPHLCFAHSIRNLEPCRALRLYYDSRGILQDAGLIQPTSIVPSALLQEASHGEARLLCIFGGQGNTEDLLGELIDLDATYQPICRPFMQAITTGLESVTVEEFEAAMMGTDFLQWLDHPESRPPKERITANAAISMPLIGLLQLTNFYINYRLLGLPFPRYQEKFTETTGHSQGIISAAVVATATSEESFVQNARASLKLLKIMGDICMRVFPAEAIEPKVLSDAAAGGEEVPTPMLSIHHLTLEALQKYVNIANDNLLEDEKIFIALLNGTHSFVCAGPPRSLCGLTLLLKRERAPEGLDQSKIPFARRQRPITMRFLPIMVPFHSPYLLRAVELILARCSADGLVFGGEDFGIALRSQATGTRLGHMAGAALIRNLVEQVCIRPVDWRAVVESSNPTHFLDHGPGHLSGVGALIHKDTQGRGQQVVLAGTAFAVDRKVVTRGILFQEDRRMLPMADNWGEKFKPRLVFNAANGKIYVETKFSRLIGKQPIMVAGMTPTTVDDDFVAAVTNAGYHVELAGGGHYNEEMLRRKIDTLLSKMEPGHTITLNVLFINQRQWSFQYPLVQSLRRAGYPIEGFTVAAGVPSLEAASEIIKTLTEAGIKHISFKPSSVDSILDVVAIAKNNPSVPIILQWTGGRAGGHHSYEDFHEPMLQTYAAIRSAANICLVAGSGFGDGEGTYPYLTGAWSTRFGRPLMPFDGILLGSRMMVARECKTSRVVKELICQTPGISEESDWVRSYKEPAGGVVTVISELGEPIHKIATRAVLLWKEFDETLFRLPKAELVVQLREKSGYIIDRLNRDAHRVWFGRDSNGQPVPLHEMTYGEILVRLAALLFVQRQSRWIDPSYKQLFLDVFLRFEERLVPVSEQVGGLPPIEDPVEFASHLVLDHRFRRCIAAEDATYVVELFRRPSQKPVPFVPVLDEHFETWFKKDSLWQSEDVDALCDADPQRTCILQGPVAVRYCTRADEPAKDILDNIVQYHIEELQRESYKSNEECIPTEEWFGTQISLVDGAAPLSSPLHSNAISDSSTNLNSNSNSNSNSTSNLTSTIQVHLFRGKYDSQEWLRRLAGGRKWWLSALLSQREILQQRYLRPNAMRDVFCADAVCSASLDPHKVLLLDSQGRSLLEAWCNGNAISIVLHNYGPARHSELVLRYTYNPSTPAAIIQEVPEDRIGQIRRFYWDVWFGQNASEAPDELALMDSRRAIFKTHFCVGQEQVSRYCDVVGNHNGHYRRSTTVPLDYAIVIAWEPVIKCLFTRDAEGDLLRLVHLSNSFTVLDQTRAINVDDVIEVEAWISAIRWTPTGKIIRVSAKLSVDQTPLIDCHEEFMYRGTHDQTDTYYEREESVVYRLRVDNQDMLTLLRDKSWIRWTRGADSVVFGGPTTLRFTLEYYHAIHAGQNNIVELECRGVVEQERAANRWTETGRVMLSSSTPLSKNPVLEFLDRHARREGQAADFGLARPMREHEFDDIKCLRSNECYSLVSGDTNPIHTSAMIAACANLPGCIVHGMWTSAAVRSVIERALCLQHPERVKRYQVFFESMVLPSDELTTQMEHRGMRRGLMLCSFQVLSKTSGVVVMRGEVDVKMPRSAFLFTGQGSQHVGMGMDLFESSVTARGVWERAERHFRTTYGISILEIVRKNPRSLTVYFGGREGHRIRATYQSLMHEATFSDGTTEQVPLFPEITEETASYTFNCPHGLLYATHFTQPILTLMEKAAFEDLRSKGLVSDDSYFAGHSLGEYAALASVANVLPEETLCDIVFYRGLTMQIAVERDAAGHSDFGMAAVNPQRAGIGFPELSAIVRAIAGRTGRLLELVNHNVENWQYVVAGHVNALNMLTSVLDVISRRDDSDADYESLIDDHATASGRHHERELKRGTATIPLAGIDVPFHSSYLVKGVNSFRRCLEGQIPLDAVDPSLLQDKYIPNLVGKPFDLSLSYVEKILEHCPSPILFELAHRWRERTSLMDARRTARVILIELLSYQFASPVLWIQTQHSLLKEGRVECLIEIGPTPTLCTMAERTLNMHYRTHDMVTGLGRKVLHVSRDRSVLFYEDHADVASPTPTTPIPEREEREASRAAQPDEAAGTGTSSKVPPAVMHQELPITALEVLHALVSIKLKKPIEEVPVSKSIKELSSGKSTLQNEILADLHKEFGDKVPDRAEEASLQDLATRLGPHFSKAPGPLTNVLISKLFAAKMPPGFSVSSARAVLERQFGLQGKSADQLLLASLHLEPAGRLATEEEAVQWLRLAVHSLFKRHGISLSTTSNASPNHAQKMISSAELEKWELKQRRLTLKQIEILADYLESAGRQDVEDSQGQIAALQEYIDNLTAELGEKLCEGVKGRFSALKARRYNSSWNWRRQRVYAWVQTLALAKHRGLELGEEQRILLPLLTALCSDSLRRLCAYELQRRGPGGGLRDLLDMRARESLVIPIYDSIVSLTRPEVTISPSGDIRFAEVERGGVGNLAQYIQEMAIGSSGVPHIFLCERQEPSGSWCHSSTRTETYLAVLREMALSESAAFAGRKALVTGCGQGSIGFEIIRGLLLAGAKVIATTSSFNRHTIENFRRIYEECCVESSELVLVPFNQASTQDIESLIEYIFRDDPKTGLGWDLDYVIPFAAVPEKGRELADLEDASDLAHRLMLTSVLRILGCVIKAKRARGIECHPTQAVLPLSPNHGVFGGDGLYGESKLGLETLFNRWHSETWGDQLSIVGASIGWTRGTGLMSDNNLLAPEIEKLGVRTFSPGEMAFTLLGLMHPKVGRLADASPIYANLNGGLDRLPNLAAITKGLREKIADEARIGKLLWQERQLERSLEAAEPKPPSPPRGKPRSHFEFSYPDLPAYEDLPRDGLSLESLLDLSQVVVVTGFAEVGPWGNSRTRWEMEAFGEFSLEGCIEMAWIMGMITFRNEVGGHVGWVDAKTGEPVADHEIKQRYESQILKHSGVRLVEPELFGGYDPERKIMCREVVLEQDMALFEVGKEEADHFKRLHQERADIFREPDGSWRVRLKKGAVLYIPKALRFDRLVAGQLPTGWNAERYGVPRDIVEQVDPCTLFALVSTVEALVAAGITDPYEFYEYVHVSEVGNTAGGGEGGLLSNRSIFLHRFLDKPVQADILQESFINTMPAWINLLLLGSSGPIKTPVGACATAVQSVDIGVETILSGKAKIVIAGGYDDFQEESAFEFASMQATSNSRDEMARGREPHEMSRPASSSRSGFMEAQGAGIQILMSAELALRMGCPIYGVIALTNTAMDKIGRSVPAPGQGILTTAKCVPDPVHRPRILDLEYRRTQLTQSLVSLKSKMQQELFDLHHRVSKLPCSKREQALNAGLLDIENEFTRRGLCDKRFWGSEFWKGDARISPIEGALAVFGLTVDDINVSSFHGTGTKANDVNEATVVNTQMTHLGRNPANLLPCIFQKYLTGHPKGAAASWMLNGVLQAMNTGIVPGNRNADNIDERLRDCEYLLFPSRSMAVGHIRAALIKSFGFGQVGGELVVVHPWFLYRALSKHQYEEYAKAQQERHQRTYRYMHNVLVGNHALVQVKESPPYSTDLESAVYLNPKARATRDRKTGGWSFNERALPSKLSPESLAGVMSGLMGLEFGGQVKGVGVDVQLISDVSIENDTFLEHNFTSTEVEYCAGRMDPRASFAGRWAAKEAVFKALSEAGHRLRGPAGSLKMIEIASNDVGVPIVQVDGIVDPVRVSISHSGEYAVAVAIVNK